MELTTMKRIALLVCGLVLLVANTAEARRNRWSNNRNYAYTYPTYTQSAVPHTTHYAPATSTTPAAPVAETDLETTTSAEATTTASAEVATAAAHTTAAANVRAVSYSTATAQGVANLMAAYNRVGHFGGNPGYEGCGCGPTPAAAYAICCYGNSGMATVDVGYAQGANGMWYCCRRYR
jgi:hypothetical protein